MATGLYLLSFGGKNGFYRLENLFNRPSSINLRVNKINSHNIDGRKSYKTKMVTMIVCLAKDVKSSTKKKYLPNFSLGFIVLNHGKTRLKENLEPLPYCFNVIIFSSLESHQNDKIICKCYEEITKNEKIKRK